MTPRQESEAAELGTAVPAPDTAEHLKGYEHQDYNNSDFPLIGGALNEIQRDYLAVGVPMRTATQLSHTNVAYYDHPELKQKIDASKPSQAHELGQLWNALGNEIMQFGENLHNTATNSEAVWVGQAGNAARSALSELATWSQHTGQGVQFMGTTVRTQAEAAENAKTAMPEPPVQPYDPVQSQAQLNSISDPIERWQFLVADNQRKAEQEKNLAEARQVVETYSATLRDTNTAMPAFTPPPTFGNGDTGHTPSVPPPGGRTGGALPPASGAGGGVPGGGTTGGAPGNGAANPPTAVGTDVGKHGSGGAAPASTPAQSVSYAPEIPGGGVPTGENGGEPSFLPAAVIGEAGPGSGRGSSAGSRNVGGRFGPRGSSGLSTGNPRTSNPRNGNSRTPKPPASTFDSDPRSNPQRRGAGATSGLPPMPGTVHEEKDAEHRRPSYLIETEDIWGDGRHVAPPVIGEDPPEYHY